MNSKLWFISQEWLRDWRCYFDPCWNSLTGIWWFLIHIGETKGLWKTWVKTLRFQRQLLDYGTQEHTFQTFPRHAEVVERTRLINCCASKITAPNQKWILKTKQVLLPLTLITRALFTRNCIPFGDFLHTFAWSVVIGQQTLQWHGAFNTCIRYFFTLSTVAQISKNVLAPKWWFRKLLSFYRLDFFGWSKFTRFLLQSLNLFKVNDPLAQFYFILSWRCGSFFQCSLVAHNLNIQRLHFLESLRLEYFGLSLRRHLTNCWSRLFFYKFSCVGIIDQRLTRRTHVILDYLGSGKHSITIWVRTQIFPRFMIHIICLRHATAPLLT